VSGRLAGQSACQELCPSVTIFVTILLMDYFFQKFVLLKFRTADTKRVPYVKKRLSLKQRRELGLYTINRKGMKYKDFEELHCLWKEYMRSCLGLAEIEKRG
jgi:hypothetical protein